MCRGLDEKETKTIKNGQFTENVFFGISRVYVPIALFVMYRRGVFSDSLTTREIKSVIKIAL